MGRYRSSDPGPTSWRAPKSPARILQERRVPPLIDQMRRPRSLEDLTPEERALYDAQLDALRAGLGLVAAENHLHEYGSLGDIEPVKRFIERWDAARAAYRALLAVHLQRRT